MPKQHLIGYLLFGIILFVVNTIKIKRELIVKNDLYGITAKRYLGLIFGFILIVLSIYFLTFNSCDPL